MSENEHYPIDRNEDKNNKSTIFLYIKLKPIEIVYMFSKGYKRGIDALSAILFLCKELNSTT